MGRPRKEIDETQFEKLCSLQCTLEEIADWFECSTDTIERWCQRTYQMRYADVFAIKRGKGKIALRRAQFELARKHPAMAIFLGKNYLGQRDKSEVVATHSGKIVELIEGLKEPDIYDLHAEAEGVDGTMEDGQA